MLQKPENITKELFLAHVEKLQLRFPVATIAQATGFSKSNVSQYLKGKMMPSVNFLKAFYKWLSDSNINVSEENLIIQENDPTDNYSSQSERIKELKAHIRSLETINATLQQRIESVETYLKQNQEFLKVIMAQIKAASRMAVERSAGVDKKKMIEERRTLDRYVGEYLAEDY